MATGKPTLREIARLANVHYATASYVLNGARSSTRVSEETRQRVLAAARELGYTVNRAAQQLRTRRSHVVGLLVGGLENPFFARMVSLCAIALERRGYEFILNTRRADESNDLHLLETLNSRRPDGMILWCETPTQVLERAQQPDMENVVVIGYLVPNRDSVRALFTTGLQEAVDHLCERGYRRIGYVAPASAVARNDVRGQFYNQFAEKNGQAPLVYTYPGTAYDVGAARACAEQIADDPQRPDALLCFNDMTALGVLSGLRRKGIRVPQDMGLVGCDDLPLISQLDLPLTTLSYPLEEICNAAVNMLMERLNALYKGEELPPRHVEVPTHLIIRSST
ncbi:transcriptional regulator, LacI family [Chthonomonas calidirosea]|uniref:Transcriptional regulator, LacI family n=1 Tax=Chthonomonas calidirosea (strain DSM 23976 / ICMP 18418 / T49) TaxID=1303518 RepID=S0EZN8_CHTCT|nr:LacI family DNA-binding transcriptional regulator [Chthonomonas calidirosea]CCW35959.1 transcriptional regulator, LacI family [Chthonomonas calidirosea T49]CEK18743.1 transcriptional regulator, LacI family [Chthonomonas calidirosea]